MTVRTPIVRRTRLGPALLVVAAAHAPLTACTRSGDAPAPTPCAAAVNAAANAVELDEQKRLLDASLLQCRSLNDLENEVARHPGMLGHGVDVFIERRCGRVEDPAILAAPICAASTSAAPDTAPVPVEAEIVFVGDTLDGRRIELRPGPNTPFDGDVPAVVRQTVDIADDVGCPGVLEQRDRWFALVDDPAIGDEASVYARHAENVAAYLGCVIVPEGSIPPHGGNG